MEHPSSGYDLHSNEDFPVFSKVPESKSERRNAHINPKKRHDGDEATRDGDELKPSPSSPNDEHATVSREIDSVTTKQDGSSSPWVNGDESKLSSTSPEHATVTRDVEGIDYVTTNPDGSSPEQQDLIHVHNQSVMIDDEGFPPQSGQIQHLIKPTSISDSSSMDPKQNNPWVKNDSPSTLSHRIDDTEFPPMSTPSQSKSQLRNRHVKKPWSSTDPGVSANVDSVTTKQDDGDELKPSPSSPNDEVTRDVEEIDSVTTKQDDGSESSELPQRRPITKDDLFGGSQRYEADPATGLTKPTEAQSDYMTEHNRVLPQLGTYKLSNRLSAFEEITDSEAPDQLQ